MPGHDADIVSFPQTPHSGRKGGAETSPSGKIFVRFQKSPRCSRCPDKSADHDDQVFGPCPRGNARTFFDAARVASPGFLLGDLGQSSMGQNGLAAGVEKEIPVSPPGPAWTSAHSASAARRAFDAARLIGASTFGISLP